MRDGDSRGPGFSRRSEVGGVTHVLQSIPSNHSRRGGEFQRQLEVRLRHELSAAFLPIPADVADLLRDERRLIEQLQTETHDVATWLEQREQAASIAGLYGK